MKHFSVLLGDHLYDWKLEVHYSEIDFAVYSHGRFIFKIFLCYTQDLNALKGCGDLVVTRVWVRWHRMNFSFALSTNLSSLEQWSNPRLEQESWLHHSDFSHRNVKPCGEKKSYFLVQMCLQSVIRVSPSVVPVVKEQFGRHYSSVQGA